MVMITIVFPFRVGCYLHAVRGWDACQGLGCVSSAAR